MSGDNPVSRRNVLRATGGALAASGSALAAAGPDQVVEVNVGFDADAGRRAAVDAADDVVQEFDLLDVVTVRGAKRAVTGLRQRPDVRYVEENGTMHALAQSLPWGIDRVDAEIAHADGETGSGADVAIIDTGIDSDHPDLQANLGQGHSVVSCGTRVSNGPPCRVSGNGNACSQPWDDDNDHGTHCAGIADAIDNTRAVVGVSTEATLHAIKVLDCAGSGTFSDVARGIEIAANQGYDVASMSLGGSQSSAVADAVETAASAGVTLVAAAGNSGPCTDCVGYPAAEPEVIAVSSTAMDDTLSDFSSTGPEVELAAPGTDVTSTVPGGTAVFSGTSMACPHVSGAAAQLAADGLSRSNIRSTLKSNAESIGLGDNESGAGLLDVAAALGLDSSDST